MKRLILILIAAMFLTGCSFKYDTVDKDISLKIRSVVVDADYDSRENMDELVPLEDSEIEPLEPIKEIE